MAGLIETADRTPAPGWSRAYFCFPCLPSPVVPGFPPEICFDFRSTARVPCRRSRSSAHLEDSAGSAQRARKGMRARCACTWIDLAGADAEALASQLAAVIDRRLPARLNEASDEPEGSSVIHSSLTKTRRVIQTADGKLDILVERVDRGKAEKSGFSPGRPWPRFPMLSRS